jgi:hypothetical protein
MIRDIEITWGNNREFVRLLSERGTRFLIVGGTAVRFHAPQRREPADLDLLVEPFPEALASINAALVVLGAPLILVTAQEFAQPDKRFSNKNLLNVDVLTPPARLNFGDLWAGAEEAVMSFSPTHLRVASNATLQTLLRLAQEREPSRALDFAKDIELLQRVEQW